MKDVLPWNIKTNEWKHFFGMVRNKTYKNEKSQRMYPIMILEAFMGWQVTYIR